MAGKSKLYSLGAFPMRDQLTEPGYHGPNQNARENCVAESACAGVQKLTGVYVSADRLHDMVYGNTTGGGSGERYVAALRQFGVSLTVYKAKGATARARQKDLIARTYLELAAGHPCLWTIPSNWNGPAPKNPDAPGPSHCVVVHSLRQDWSELGGAMNPWHGVDQWETVERWSEILCYSKLYPMAKLSTGGTSSAPATLPRPSWVPSSAKPVASLPGWWDDGAALFNSANRYKLVSGFRQAMLAAPHADAADVPLMDEQAQPLMEYGNAGIKAGTWQATRYGVWEWNAASGVFRMAAGQELLWLRTHYGQILDQLSRAGQQAGALAALLKPAA